MTRHDLSSPRAVHDICAALGGFEVSVFPTTISLFFPSTTFGTSLTLLPLLSRLSLRCGIWIQSVNSIRQQNHRRPPQITGMHMFLIQIVFIFDPEMHVWQMKSRDGSLARCQIMNFRRVFTQDGPSRHAHLWWRVRGCDHKLHKWNSGINRRKRRGSWRQLQQ